MLADCVNTAMAELAGAPDISAARACLDRVGAALLQAPQDGAALVRALGRAGEDDDLESDLQQILSAALDSARMAQEKGRARGGVLIAALEAVVAQLRKQGGLTLPGSLALARAWVRAGLVPPAHLAVPDRVMADAAAGHGPVDPEQIEAMIDDMFGDLARQAEGGVAAMHEALTEMLPALPAEVREALITAALTRPGGWFGRLGCAFLLDPSPGTRLAAAQGLAARLAAGRLEPQVAADLVTLRSWLPKDAARACLDTLLHEALRRGVSGGTARQPWQVHKILATLPDGTGSQSIGVSIQHGSQRALAMLLLKQDFGVKDAYTIPCTSATEQRKILASLQGETGALPVPPGYLVQALELALADGLSRGLPPAAGLLAIAEACGLTGLRPQGRTTAELLAEFDPEATVRPLAAGPWQVDQRQCVLARRPPPDRLLVRGQRCLARHARYRARAPDHGNRAVEMAGKPPRVVGQDHGPVGAAVAGHGPRWCPELCRHRRVAARRPCPAQDSNHAGNPPPDHWCLVAQRRDRRWSWRWGRGRAWV